MRRIRRLAVIIIVFFAGLWAAGCGQGTLVFGGHVENSEQNVTLGGDIDDVVPVVATRDIVVFVFSGLADTTAFLSAPETYSDFDDGEAAAVEAGSSLFSVSAVASGDLTVIFLLDEAEPDGQINVGDPVAILSDPDETLVEVRGGQSVTIENVDIDFNAATAFAEDISVSSAE
mgnify:CR=1 FL=1